MEILGETDNTNNGLIYKLVHRDTKEERSYRTIKCAVEAFLADHKTPWYIHEMSSAEGFLIVELEMWYCWGRVVQHMHHYGYSWEGHSPFDVETTKSIHELENPGRFIQRHIFAFDGGPFGFDRNRYNQVQL